jgi:hypothetical protein
MKQDFRLWISDFRFNEKTNPTSDTKVFNLQSTI